VLADTVVRLFGSASTDSDLVDFGAVGGDTLVNGHASTIPAGVYIRERR
jgi:hypothetical protein